MVIMILFQKQLENVSFDDFFKEMIVKTIDVLSRQ